MQISFRKLIVAATFSLAIIGIAVAQNENISIGEITTLAKSGNVDRQLQLGKMYYYGTDGVDKDLKEAEDWLSKAANKGNIEAAFLLGKMYYNGELDKAGKPDYNKAIKYFNAVIDNSFNEKKDFIGNKQIYAESSFYLGDCYTSKNDEPKALNCYKNAASNGNLEAQKLLANKFFNGDGVEKNIEEYRKYLQMAANNGDTESVSSLIDLYTEGYGNEIPKNPEKVVELLEQLAKEGNNEAANRLGMMFFNGEGTKQNYSEALRYLQQAADGGITEADYYVGLSYLYGLGTKSDANIASNYFAKDGNSFVSKFCLAVCSRLGAKDKNLKTLSYGQLADSKEAYNSQFNSFIEETTKYALPNANKPTAQYVAGIMDSYGIGKDKDLFQAFAWFQKAADKKILPAMVDLGYCYEVGEGTKVDMQEAIRWYRTAADLGDPVAQCNLGLCYANGDGVAKNPIEAFKYYEKAANKGYAPAQCNLGYCYETGEGIGRNPQQAVLWYKKAADQGYAIAQCNLAYCYENGIGTDKNLKEAVNYYQLAANQGNDRALENLINIYSQITKYDTTALANASKYLLEADEKGILKPQTVYMLGYCYDKGYGVDKNMANALEYYKRAADENNKPALDELVVYYTNPKTKESKESAKYLELAANNGNARAQYNIGLYYEKGSVVTKNVDKAFKYFLMAAKQNLDKAQFKVANCYENGIGVDKNIEEARKWYKEAAAQGNTEAVDALKNLEKTLKKPVIKTPPTTPKVPSITSSTNPEESSNNGGVGNGNELIEEAIGEGTGIMENQSKAE